MQLNHYSCKNFMCSFSVTQLFFIHHFGYLAIPNIRGGGEYGEKWHNGGRLLKKQNGFNDFQVLIFTISPYNIKSIIQAEIALACSNYAVIEQKFSIFTTLGSC